MSHAKQAPCKHMFIWFIATFFIFLNCTVAIAESSSALEIGQPVTISTSYGDFSIQFDGAHVVDWPYATEGRDGAALITVQAVVKNISFSGMYDHRISTYELGMDYINITDDDDFALEYYDAYGYADGLYTVGAEIAIGSKMRVSLPFFISSHATSVNISVPYMSSLNLPLDELNTLPDGGDSTYIDIDALYAQIESLESENAALRERIFVLEEQLSSANIPQNTNISSAEHSRAILSPYFDMFGTDITNGTPEVTQEFIDNMNAIDIMGIAGSITHGYNIDTERMIIDIMDWVSNDGSYTQSYFDEYRLKLDLFFSNQGTAYDAPHIAEKPYKWIDYTEMSIVLAWYENGHIYIRWDYDPEYVRTLRDNDFFVTNDPTIMPTQVPTSTSSPSPTAAPTTPECMVDDCNRPATKQMTGWAGTTEFYCQTHYDEIGDMMQSMIDDVSTKPCEVDGCENTAYYDIIGFSGLTEYYCYEHYKEMESILNMMFSSAYSGN